MDNFARAFSLSLSLSLEFAFIAAKFSSVVRGFGIFFPQLRRQRIGFAFIAIVCRARFNFISLFFPLSKDDLKFFNVDLFFGESILQNH